MRFIITRSVSEGFLEARTKEQKHNPSLTSFARLRPSLTDASGSDASLCFRLVDLPLSLAPQLQRTRTGWDSHKLAT